MATSRGVRLARTLVVVVLLAATWWLLAPTQLGGRTTYVTTHGISMEPRFRTGDLGVLRETGTYRVGDVAGYRSAVLHTVVMHRIVAITDGRFTFKGDNNSWLDPEQPTQEALLGSLVLRVPQGGAWLAQVRSPVALSVLAFLLVAATGTGLTRRRRRRRRAMSRHTAPLARPATPVEPLRLVTVVALVLGVLAAGLTALAWTTPVEISRAAQATPPPRMTFSYTARVRAGAAYDTTSVSSPDPVFRKVAKRVVVAYEYRGGSGTIGLVADLSSASGWRSSVRLARPVAFAGGRYSGRARLDLAAFQRRAEAAAAATGMPVGAVTVAVRPEVRTPRGDFAPVLRLTLTPLQLALAGSRTDLVVVGTAAKVAPVVTPATVGPSAWAVPVRTARTASVIALLLALGTAALGLALARRAAPPDEGAAIRRRYGALLVPVRAGTVVPGRVVEVDAFATLAKLAERYGLLVLHWSAGGVDTFVVQDERTGYRYTTDRAEAVLPAAAPARSSRAVPAAADGRAPAAVRPRPARAPAAAG